MAADNNGSEVKLRRVLTLGDLIVYGIVLIQPVAALPLFGHANAISTGPRRHHHPHRHVRHDAHGRQLRPHGRPVSGRGFGVHLRRHGRWIRGWGSSRDGACSWITCSSPSSASSTPASRPITFCRSSLIPSGLFCLPSGFTLLNLNGIKVASRANWAMMAVMSAVVFWFMAMAVRYIWGVHGPAGLVSMKPFYDPASFSWSAVGSGTALAALTYIGFDGLTTLSEEVENPRRNVLLAAVLTCLITGIWSGAQVYLAQISWPDWASFTRGAADEAGRRPGTGHGDHGRGQYGSAGLGAGRRRCRLSCSWAASVPASPDRSGPPGCLYGMGRDGVLPQRIFAHLDRKHAAPSRNILFIGALTLAGAAVLNYEESARLINFGAFLAFIGVNLAAHP